MRAKRANSAAARQRFETVALPHLDAVYTAALRLARDPDDAKDLLQETILRAYQFFHQFTPGTNCRAWLLTILYNNFRNQLRSHARQPTGSFNDEDSNENVTWNLYGYEIHDPEEIVAMHGLGRRLEVAIERLPEEFREALLLVDLQDLSYLEVAAVLQVPVGTVKSRVSRARSMLRAMLSELLYARGKTGT